MKKNILILTFLTILFGLPTLADEINLPPSPEMQRPIMPPHKPTAKDFKEMDKKLAQRLNLSDEQVKVLKTNRQKNIKELEKTISKMEATHKKIRNIYLLGLPKYQADLKSAPYKMELAILKQNADNIRKQNRKNFEAILTPEQKIEFKKFREELPKRPPLRWFYLRFCFVE